MRILLHVPFVILHDRGNHKTKLNHTQMSIIGETKLQRVKHASC